MIAALRQKLLEQRRSLFRQLHNVEADLRWLDTNVRPELEEEAQEENVARLLAQLDDRAKEELEAIDRALTRIESGDYGRCEDCGELIPLERLEALPTTTLCVSCSEARERRPA